MKNNHHTRKGYEQLLRNICREEGIEYPPNIKDYTDEELLTAINYRLIQNNCEPFTVKELIEIELKKEAQ